MLFLLFMLGESRGLDSSKKPIPIKKSSNALVMWLFAEKHWKVHSGSGGELVLWTCRASVFTSPPDSPAPLVNIHTCHEGMEIRIVGGRG